VIFSKATGSLGDRQDNKYKTCIFIKYTKKDLAILKEKHYFEFLSEIFIIHKIDMIEL
jgi:hypothetical protein